jgi:cobalt-zinc-cadmium efflux system outer membrane protein
MRKILMLFLTIAILMFIVSCTTSRTTAYIPEPRPLVKNYTTVLDSADQEYVEEPISEQKNTLSMAEAIQLALLKNPELQSYSIEIRAREARTLQESFAPNPGIEFEIENFGGSGEFSGFNGSEITLSVGQLIELAGKREKRTRAAAFGSDLAAWNYEAQKLDLLTETVRRYVKMIGDQEQILLNQELVAVSEKLLQSVNRLVQAGKISPAEISRTQILLSTAQLELNRSQRKIEADRIRLASLWADTSPDFVSVSGSLEDIGSIPPLDSLKKYLSENPDIVRWVTEIEMRQAVEELERAKQIPDPLIQAGYRHLSEVNSNAFVANLSVPIPIFNTNKGAVQEAYNRLKKAEEQQRQTEIAISTNFIELYQNLQILYTNIENSNKTIIPEAEKAYQVINDGYLSGKFRFLDVLDAQRTLYETRKNLIASLTEYNIRVAEIERLIGRSLASVTN